MIGVGTIYLDGVPRDAAEALASGARAQDAEAPEPTRGRVIAVWGAAGAPGRTTTAIELACELARDGRRVALIDADAHAPSIAMATGLADEGPGFAAACRQAERGQGQHDHGRVLVDEIGQRVGGQQHAQQTEHLRLGGRVHAGEHVGEARQADPRDQRQQGAHQQFLHAGNARDGARAGGSPARVDLRSPHG